MKNGGLALSLKTGLCLLAITMLSVALAPPAFSQTASPSAAPAPGESQEVRVVVAVVPPFVMQQNGNLTGFSIDLWNAIAARLKIKTNYQLDAQRSRRRGRDAIEERRPDRGAGFHNLGAR